MLATHGHFIEIPDEEVADRSKANPIAKALVCSQVLWFFLQCVVRTTRRYSLALLEIHAMVHVVCAILIYILWWKVFHSNMVQTFPDAEQKPLDVEILIEIDGSQFQDILALILMSNKAFNPHDPGIAELSQLEYWRSIEESSKDPQVESSEQTSTSISGGLSIGEEVKPLILRPGNRLSCGFGLKLDQSTQIVLNEKDKERWRLGAKAVSSIPKSDQELYPVQFSGNSEDEPLSKLFEVYPKVDRAAAINGIIDTISGGSEPYFHNIFRKTVDLNKFARSIQAVALFLLPIISSGIHLAARNIAFPSHIERTMWLISCIATMIMLPAGELLLMIFRAILIVGITMVETCFCTARKEFSDDRFEIGFMSANVALIAFYVACRAFIVVEVFISLRSTPLGVFASTPWLQGIPHI